jgi:hypothetical protein
MQRRQGEPTVSAYWGLGALLATVATTASIAAGCGGSGADEKEEAQEIVQTFKSLKRGEFLIQGRRSEKFSGPYRLRRGGYLLRFRRLGDDGRVTVALESQRGSRQRPFQLVLTDFDGGTAQRKVTVSGTFYVHVTSSADGYVLRFTPRRTSA